MKISEIKTGTNHSRCYGNGSVAELAESMREHGLLCPVGVDDQGYLVFGFRRLEAAVSLGWEEIATVLVSGTAAANLVENMVRENLSLWEEIRGIRDVFGESPSKAEVARSLSKSLTWVKPRVDAWKLPQEIINRLMVGDLDISGLRKALSEKRGSSISQRHFGFPNKTEISSAISRLIGENRVAEAEALGYAIGIRTLDNLFPGNDNADLLP